jgi:hypothetical protein
VPRPKSTPFETLATLGPPADKEHAIDSTIVQAHQHAAGVKWGIENNKRSAARAAAGRRKIDRYLWWKRGVIDGLHPIV